MTDDALTLRQAAALRENGNLHDESDRNLAELKMHAREISRAYQKLRAVCAEHGMALEELLGE